MAKKLKWIALAGLLTLMILFVALSWGAPGGISSWRVLQINGAPSKAEPRQQTSVNLEPWQTAEALAALAVSAPEGDYARQAENLADHEVDQAFGAALREAMLQKPSLPPEAAALAKKVAELQAVVTEDAVRVRELTAHDPDDNLDIAKAQLDLDTDQLTEGKKDLTRAGGNQRDRIQEELSVHEAAMQNYDTRVASQKPVTNNTRNISTTVASDADAWFQERTKYERLEHAALQSRNYAAVLVSQHEHLEHGAGASEGGDKASHLASLSSESTRSQLLGIYDDQIQTLKELANTYQQWAEQVLVDHRTTGRLIMRALALIIFLLIGLIIGVDLVPVIANRSPMERRKSETLVAILRMSIKAVSVVLILLVIFGRPSQLPTILGLATAGLTVALQDFIVAFIGWFVLMGRNGMRVGDWVEINGVAGEIVHISLFRTSMLEMGNAHNKGRPTGRRTAFSNSFAIRGQYFNFSTSGQWMWDEIRVSIPADRDASATIEQVREHVLKETVNDAREAEEEWRLVSHHFDADLAVDIRPGSSGIDMVVRYVTRRFGVRNRLYHQILGLLRKTQDEVEATRP